MTLAEILIRVGVDASRVASGLGAAEKSLESFGTRLFFLGSRITAGVSAPAAAAIATVANLGIQFDQSMSEALAIMDKVGPKVRSQMEDVAKSITTYTKFSADEGAKAFYDLASAGLDAQTSMAALPVVARFAQAGLIDLAKAGEYLAGAQAALSDSSADATQKVAEMARISDVLTKANNIALGTVEDFAKALTNKAGQQLRIFHKDVEEGVAVLAAYAQQNIKGAAAGTQLYMAIRDLARFATKNADAFKQQGIAVFDASGNMRNMADIIADFEKRLQGASNQQAALLFQVLGMTDRSRAATQALIGYSDVIREFEKQLRNAGGTTKEVADKQMEALKAQLLSVYHQFQALLIDVFKDFEPIVRGKIIPALQGLVDVGKDFEQWLKGTSEGTKEWILAAAGFAVVIGPLTAFIGSWALLVKAVSMPLAPIFEALAVSTTAAGTAMGGTATAATGLTTVSGGLSTALGAVFSTTGALVAAMGAGIYIVKELAGGWSNLGAGLIESVPELRAAADLWGMLLGVWQEIRGPLGNVVSLVIELARLGASITWDGLKNFWLYLKSISEVQANMSGGGQVSLAAPFKELVSWLDLAVPGLKMALDFLNRMSVSAGKAATQLRDARSIEEMFTAAKNAKDIALPGGDDFLGKSGLMRVNPGAAVFDVTGRTKYDAFNGSSIGLNLSPSSKPTFPKVGEAGNKPNSLPKGLETVSDLVKAFRTNMQGLGEVYTDFLKTGKPIEVLIEAYGTQFENTGKKAQVYKENVSDAFKAGYDVVQKYNLTQFLKDQDSELVTSGKSFVDTFKKYATDLTPAVKASTDEQFKVVQELQTKVADLGKWGTDQEIAQINRAKQAEIDAVTAKSDIAESTRKQEIALIEQYYNHQIDVANKTYGTLVERMHKAGIDTEDEQKRTADKLKVTWQQMMEYNSKAADGFKFKIEDVQKAWQAWYTEINKPNPMTKFWGTVDTTISPFVREFKNLTTSLQDSTSGFADFVRGFSDVLQTMEMGAKAAQTVSKSFDGIKTAIAESKDGVVGWGKDMAEGLIGLATGITSGVSALAASTDPSKGSNLSRIVGGATTGAELGSSVGAGVYTIAAGVGAATAKGAMVAGAWGAAAGAVIGIFVAVLRGRGARQEMAKVGKEWGVTISEAMADEIKKSADKDFKGQDIAASLFRMQDIVKAAGGINETNLNDFTNKLRDTFSMLDRGLFSIKNAKTVLNDNFKDIADGVVNTGQVATRAFQDIISLSAKWGLDIKDIAAFVTEQATKFGTDMESIVKANTYTFTGLADKIAEAQKTFADLNNDPNAKQEDIQKAAQTVTDLLNQQSAAAATSAEKMAALTGVILSGFVASMKDGTDIMTALNAQGPAIDAIIQAYKDLGIQSDNAALDQLINLRKLQDTYPDLVKGVGALGDSILTLSYINGLNADSFSAIQKVGMGMYDDLSAKAAELGLDNSAAIEMMVPFLKAVISANEMYGYGIDDNTQKLIDQARQMGLLKDDQLGTNDILMQGFAAIITALGGEIPEAFKAMAQTGKDAFGGVADTAMNDADKIAQHFRDMQIETVDVPFRFVQNGDTPSPPQMDVPAFGSGAIVRKSTIAEVGERGPEAIMPLDDLSNIVKDGREPVGGDVYLDSYKVGKVMLSRQKTILRANGIRS